MYLRLELEKYQAYVDSLSSGSPNLERDIEKFAVEVAAYKKFQT